MSVIVDTSVWSLALRRNAPDSEISDRLRTLIAEDEVLILGAIRQEILSGLRTSEQFTRLRDYLRAFSDLTVTQSDYETAAEFFNTCRRNGVQGSNIDFLICAVAYRRNDSIFTTESRFHSLSNLFTNIATGVISLLSSFFRSVVRQTKLTGMRFALNCLDTL